MKALEIDKESWHYKIIKLYLMDHWVKNRYYYNSIDEYMSGERSDICSYGRLLFVSITNLILSILFKIFVVIALMCLATYISFLFGSIPFAIIYPNVELTIANIAFITCVGVLVIACIACFSYVFSKVAKKLISVIKREKMAPKEKTPSFVSEYVKSRVGKYCKRLEFK